MTCKLKTIRFGCKTQTSVSQFRVYMIWRENNMLSKSNDKAALCRFWELNISISTFWSRVACSLFPRYSISMSPLFYNNVTLEKKF